MKKHVKFEKTKLNAGLEYTLTCNQAFGIGPEDLSN